MAALVGGAAHRRWRCSRLLPLLFWSLTVALTDPPRLELVTSSGEVCTLSAIANETGGSAVLNSTCAVRAPGRNEEMEAELSSLRAEVEYLRQVLVDANLIKQPPSPPPAASWPPPLAIARPARDPMLGSRAQSGERGRGGGGLRGLILELAHATPREPGTPGATLRSCSFWESVSSSPAEMSG